MREGHRWSLCPRDLQGPPLIVAAWPSAAFSCRKHVTLTTCSNKLQATTKSHRARSISSIVKIGKLDFRIIGITCGMIHFFYDTLLETNSMPDSKRQNDQIRWLLETQTPEHPFTMSARLSSGESVADVVVAFALRAQRVNRRRQPMAGIPCSLHLHGITCDRGCAVACDRGGTVMPGGPGRSAHKAPNPQPATATAADSAM